MTTPSSTSQSVFSEPRGISTSSFGPQMALVAFMKMMGSGGTFRPDLGGVVGVVEADADELADARPTQGPSRGLPSTSGRLDTSQSLQPGQAGGRRAPAIDVVDHARQRPDPAFPSSSPGFS